MDNVLNAIAIIVGIVCSIIWIVSLSQWDGKCHCLPEDCETCPYRGTGCEIDTETKQ